MNVIGHTLASASSGGAKAWEPMASSIVQCFGRKTRTAQHPQPDDPNPNAAESIVKNARNVQAGPVLALRGHWQSEGKRLPPDKFNNGLSCSGGIHG